MTSSWGQGTSGPQQPGGPGPHGQSAPGQSPYGSGPFGPPQQGGYGQPSSGAQPGPYGLQQQGGVATAPQSYGISFSSGQPYNTLPQQRPTTNAGKTMGIVSIPVGIPLGPLGIVLGFIASQKAKRGNGPRGYGIAGMVIGALSTAVVTLVVLSTLAAAMSAYSPPDGPAPAPDPQATDEPSDPQPEPDAPDGGEVPIGAMQVGDCAYTVSAGAPIVTLVDCGEWHQAEAFTEVELGSGAYPGDDEVYEMASDACADAAGSLALPSDTDVSDLRTSTLTPNREAWDQGLTSALCLVVHAGGPNMSGSVAGGDFTVR